MRWLASRLSSVAAVSDRRVFFTVFFLWRQPCRLRILPPFCPPPCSGALSPSHSPPRGASAPQRASGIRHPASGIRHPASGIRHPASVSRLPSPVSRLPSPVSRLPSPVSRLPSPVSRLPSPVSRLPSPVPPRFLTILLPFLPPLSLDSPRLDSGKV